MTTSTEIIDRRITEALDATANAMHVARLHGGPNSPIVLHLTDAHTALINAREAQHAQPGGRS